MATKVRGVRVADELWDEAQAIAELRGEDLSAVMRARLVRYVRQHQAELKEASK